MQGYIFLHVIWAAGTRIQAQGTDGLLRADLTSGIMAGKSPLMFAPLDDSTSIRCLAFQVWFESFFGNL
jgi:hypothetical protein